MKLDFLNRRRSSVLGLTLDGRRLEGVVLRRAQGTLRVEPAFSVTLSLDVLTNDVELVGREIRNHLETAGVRQLPCVVGLPLSWALTQQIELPDLPEADLASYLNVQAERGFPYGLEDLVLSTSRFQLGAQKRGATLVAIPRNHVLLLQRALQAARLQPVGFSFLITALQPPGQPEARAVFTLAVGETNVDLQVTSGGGVVALRTLQGAVETEGGQRRLDLDLMVRELRLTLGQLPNEVREQVGALRVFGREEWTRPFVEELGPHADRMGLRLEARTVQQAEGLGPVTPTEETPPLGLALGARHLGGAPSTFDFLPPRVSAWQQATARFSSRKVLWVGASASAAVALVVGAFAWQYWRLSTLQTQWRAIEPRVTELTAMQQNIRKFRPWYDKSVRTLTILRALTEAFPTAGGVSAKTLQVKDLTEVSCAGVAQDNQSLLRMLDQLRAGGHVSDLKVQQVLGRTPQQFKFDFQWNDQATHEN